MWQLLFVIDQSNMPLSIGQFLISVCAVAIPAQAFVPCISSRAYRSSSLNNDSGGIEEIEFRIYPDGRVTEVVRGVKGNNCEKVTEGEYIIIYYGYV